MPATSPIPHAAEPMLPFGIMFTSGTTIAPKAVVHTHANAIWASRIGPRNIDLRADDRLPDLPAVLPRERAELVDVLGRSASARTVVLMPKWSTSRFWEVVAEHGDHAHLADAVRDQALWQADRPQSTRSRSASSA